MSTTTSHREQEFSGYSCKLLKISTQNMLLQYSINGLIKANAKCDILKGTFPDPMSFVLEFFSYWLIFFFNIFLALIILIYLLE